MCHCLTRVLGALMHGVGVVVVSDSAGEDSCVGERGAVAARGGCR